MDNKSRTNLQKIHGEKLRWHYVTHFIFCMLSVFPMITILVVRASFLRGEGIDVAIEEILTIVMAFSILLLPFILFAILNRFFIGKIICVLNDEGIHHKHGLIKWEDIERIEYDIKFATRLYGRLKPSYARVIGKGVDETLYHAPSALLARAKKYKKEIVCKHDIVMIIVTLLVPIVIAIVGCIFMK